MTAAIVDLFAGPGGWDEGLRLLGVADVLGIECDPWACRTAEAAGHRRLQADVTTLDPAEHPCRGLIASPPCTKFSAAGVAVGNQVLDVLADGIRAIFAGGDAAAIVDAVRAAILPVCVEARMNGRRKVSPEVAHARAVEDAATTALVLEPARWMGEPGLEWVAMEQVPSVLPLWDVYADGLRARGWSVWTGVLNAADYGVPQTRRRAILTASRRGRVTRPAPTHERTPEPTLVGELLPWVSMAEALGWPESVAVRPNQWAGFGDRRDHPAAESAPVVTGKARSWELLPGERPPVYVNRNQPKAGRRSADEPAPTVLFGHRSNDVRWVVDRRTRSKGVGRAMVQTAPVGIDRPAPTVTSKAGGQWVLTHPATTIAGDPRVARPGHQDRAGGERQHADSVRVTGQEAAVLQSFRPDYPWQGSRTRQFGQIGNAVPPLLAAHVLQSLRVGRIGEVAA